MHARDTWYEYTITLEVDSDLAKSIDESHVIDKTEAIVADADELGSAAKWFEVAETTDTTVTFELRVGTAHVHDVGEDAAREEAAAWASEMFDRVDASVAIDDLEYRGVTVPTEDGDVPIDEYHSSTSAGNDDENQDQGDSSEAVTIGSDGPSDGPEGTATADESKESESVTLDQVMGGSP
ncbi:hypothetical protein [Natronorubrum daqingense]|uniref:Uncharacterized protein n=1 Tax=Natronorubrum daqingense TaxID=588898 RepID=A0A1N7G0U5_9EURY|nr:hypothetical protein [Natronorubrum daqingense]APX98615.1 hypothetical protein BB347_18140 [Natronorubrum daqingense]SIS06178.1 hypothetical protein SAMN05421809_3644 [Natronorubrum daqingense]